MENIRLRCLPYEIEICSVLGKSLLDTTLSLSPYRCTLSALLYPNMMSSAKYASTKPEVHNALRCHHSRTDHLICTENFVKFGYGYGLRYMS